MGRRNMELSEDMRKLIDLMVRLGLPVVYISHAFKLNKDSVYNLARSLGKTSGEELPEPLNAKNDNFPEVYRKLAETENPKSYIGLEKLKNWVLDQIINSIGPSIDMFDELMINARANQSYLDLLLALFPRPSARQETHKLILELLARSPVLSLQDIQLEVRRDIINKQAWGHYSWNIDETSSLVVNATLANSLTPREANVILRRFGLDQEKETLKVVARHLSITRERVRQIEKKAISKLRRKKILRDLPISMYEQIQALMDENKRFVQQAMTAQDNKFQGSDITNSLAELVGQIQSFLQLVEQGNKPQESNILSSPISELELSVRPYNCLTTLGITTIGELVGKTESELLKTKNFGRKSLNEIKEELARLGLSLADNA